MSPVQHLEYPLPSGQIISLLVWREDLNHPTQSGNKYWKLKHNLAEAKRLNLPILTFGGAYSNHIYATAAAGKVEGIPTIGVIRGEEPENYNPTLGFAQEQGMRLLFVSRESYRQKEQPAFLENLRQMLGNFYLVPEGGSNTLGLQGCEEWGTQLAHTADIYALAAGTGTTAAGIAKALLKHQPDAEIWAFSALKNGEFLKEEAEKVAAASLPNLKIITDYHFGGYAKHTPELVQSIRQFEARFAIPLEQVYTGKAMFGLLDLIKKGEIEPHKKVCFIHTGGLQGKMDIKPNPDP